MISAPPSCIAFKIPTVSERVGYPAVTNVINATRPASVIPLSAISLPSCLHCLNVLLRWSVILDAIDKTQNLLRQIFIRYGLRLMTHGMIRFPRQRCGLSRVGPSRARLDANYLTRMFGLFSRQIRARIWKFKVWTTAPVTWNGPTPILQPKSHFSKVYNSISIFSNYII